MQKGDMQMSVSEYNKPRTYRVVINDTIITVPNNPEDGTYIAFLASKPDVCAEGGNETDAIGELIEEIAQKNAQAFSPTYQAGGYRDGDSIEGRPQTR